MKKSICITLELKPVSTELPQDDDEFLNLLVTLPEAMSAMKKGSFATARRSWVFCFGN